MDFGPVGIAVFRSPRSLNLAVYLNDLARPEKAVKIEDAACDWS